MKREREREREREGERERERGRERESSIVGKPGAGIAESELHLHRRCSKAGRAHDAYTSYLPAK